MNAEWPVSLVLDWPIDLHSAQLILGPLGTMEISGNLRLIVAPKKFGSPPPRQLGSPSFKTGFGGAAGPIDVRRPSELLSGLLTMPHLLRPFELLDEIVDVHGWQGHGNDRAARTQIDRKMSGSLIVWRLYDGQEIVSPKEGILGKNFAPELLDFFVHFHYPVGILVQGLPAFGRQGGQQYISGHRIPPSLEIGKSKAFRSELVQFDRSRHFRFLPLSSVRRTEPLNLSPFGKSRY
ncbi:hypothetical protein [Methylocaldum sp. GT1BB]|uniref:hypothetical protein n=1 Tax=Methylocaldum sp. GT1BB TaxID=3438963 RepID=UPI003DA0E3D9